MGSLGRSLGLRGAKAIAVEVLGRILQAVDQMVVAELLGLMLVFCRGRVRDGAILAMIELG